MIWTNESLRPSRKEKRIQSYNFSTQVVKQTGKDYSTSQGYVRTNKEQSVMDSLTWNSLTTLNPLDEDRRVDVSANIVKQD
jgi:hypothetical protein